MMRCIRSEGKSRWSSLVMSAYMSPGSSSSVTRRPLPGRSEGWGEAGDERPLGVDGQAPGGGPEAEGEPESPVGDEAGAGGRPGGSDPAERGDPAGPGQGVRGADVGRA